MSIKTVELDRVALYSQSVIDAELLPMIKTAEGMQLLEHEDAVARRHILRMFGRKSTFEFKAPETWWQHLKMTLRERFPRVFGRLTVRFRIATLDTGAVVTGLEPVACAKRMIIPYYTTPHVRDYEDRPAPAHEDEDDD